jgi:hypothetical protein
MTLINISLRKHGKCFSEAWEMQFFLEEPASDPPWLSHSPPPKNNLLPTALLG